jgi:hypothetical protein
VGGRADVLTGQGKIGEELASRGVRLLEQGHTVEPEHVEQVVDDRYARDQRPGRGGDVHALLQPGERGPLTRLESDDLAVQHRLTAPKQVGEPG